MERNSTRIVFLIDQCLKNGDRKSLGSVDGLINIVRLCILKILTYFDSDRHISSSPGKSNHAGKRCLEWDVAYFRGTSGRFKDKPRFQEFTLKNFEAFETELETRFRLRRIAVEDNETLDDGESDVLDSLKHALRTLIQDYTWDRPDIMSPVKLSRSMYSQSCRKKFHKPYPIELEDVKQNFAFVVAECPRDAEDCDISVVDSSALLRSFLPNDFRQQFVDRLGIRLFWIDIGNDEQIVSIL